ncbi:MAG: hypothetical protein AAF610_14240 [Pseudomonadota bacterium]
MQNGNYEESTDSDEMFTDTSMFDADEIVRQIEMTEAEHKAALADTTVSARRRAEMLREQKRLEADLAELDAFDLDD